MTKRTLRFLAIALSVGALSFVGIPTAQASTITEHCGQSHQATDDPIVFPGQPGASHLHVFAGNSATDAFSTPDSLFANKQTTCSDQPQDFSGYWVPAIYVDGVQNKTNISPYWKDAGATVEAPPFGLTFVTPRNFGQNIFFGCTQGGDLYTSPPNCTGKGKVKFRVFFPQCWDGTGNLPTDVAYATVPAGGKTCPAGFSHHITQLLVQVDLTISNAVGHTISLASGDYTTMHADWMNAFTPAAMQTIVGSLNS